MDLKNGGAPPPAAEINLLGDTPASGCYRSLRSSAREFSKKGAASEGTAPGSDNRTPDANCRNFYRSGIRSTFAFKTVPAKRGDSNDST